MEGEKEGGARKIKGGGHNTVYRQQYLMYAPVQAVLIFLCVTLNKTKQNKIKSTFLKETW